MSNGVVKEKDFDAIYAELQKMPDGEEKAAALNEMAGKARLAGKSRVGLMMTKHALVLSEDIQFARGKVDALLNLALFHYYAEDYESALVNNLQALEVAETLDDAIYQERCLNNIGSVYDAGGEYAKARSYYERAMEISRQMNRLDKLAITINNIGSIFMVEGRYDEALKHFHESLRLFQELAQDSRLGYCYSNIGEIYLRRGEIPEALEWFEKGVQQANEHQNSKILKVVLQLKANAHMQAGDYEQAEKVMLQVLRMSEERNIKYSIGAACEQLSELYEKMGQPHKAYEYFDRFVLLQVAIYEERSRLRMAEMRNLYELELKELELDMHRFRTEELHRNKTEIEQTFRKLKLAEKNLLEMEKHNAALDMSVTANHEINQPLMIINGNLDLLDLELEQPSERLEDTLQGMHDAVDAIRDILRGIRHSAVSPFDRDEYTAF